MIAKVKQEVRFFLAGLKQKDSFTRNFSYLFVSKLIVVAFTFGTTPLLTRIYSPEAYGYFSFFGSVAANFATLATLGYPTALILANDEVDFYNLFASLLLIPIVLLLVFGTAFVLFADNIVPFELADSKFTYITMTLAGALLFSWMLIFPRVNTRRSQFKTGATINIIVNAGARVGSISLGLLKPGYHMGLISGDMLGKSIGLIINIYLFATREWRQWLAALSWRAMKNVLKKYGKYPRYILTGGYLGILSAHLPLLVFPFWFDANTFGQYSLASGLIALPGILLAQPLSAVFIKKVAILRDAEEPMLQGVVRKLTYGMFLAGLLPFSVVIAFGPWLFAFALGNGWSLAGSFAAILAIYGLFELTQTSMQSVLQAFHLEKRIFHYNLMQVLLVSVMMMPGFYWQNAHAVIAGVTLAKTAASIFILFHIFRACRINARTVMVRFVLLLIFVLIIMFSTREIFRP